jgi:hypothetical protein
MNDQFLPPGSPLRPENGPYWLWSALTGMSAPSPLPRVPGDQSISSPGDVPSGGILGDFGSAAKTPSSGILGNFGQSVDDMSINPWTTPKGPLAISIATPNPTATRQLESKQPNFAASNHWRGCRISLAIYAGARRVARERRFNGV